MASCDPDASSQASQKTRAERTFVKHCRKSQWSQAEDDLLTRMMSECAIPNWGEINRVLPGKTRNQIYQRWSYVLNPGLRKGSWTVDEDRIIGEWVESHGPVDWIKLVRARLPHRSPKQCRERWRNQLAIGDRAREWSEADDAQLVQLHKQFGNQWSRIAAVMGEFTANQVKNRWNSTVSRRIERISRGERPDLRRGRRKPAAKPRSPVLSLWKTCDELFERDHRELIDFESQPLWHFEESLGELIDFPGDDQLRALEFSPGGSGVGAGIAPPNCVGVQKPGEM